MKIMNSLKKATSLAAISSLIACGGGDPSISILPSIDSFEQEGLQFNAKMDILWVIDNSGSMEPYQSELKATFSSFIKNFTARDYDYRMAVTTTDSWQTLSNNFQDRTGSVRAHSCNDGRATDVLYTSAFRNGNPFEGPSGFPIISSKDPNIDFSLNNSSSDKVSTDDIEHIFSLNVGQGTCGWGFESGLESLFTSLENPENKELYSFPRKGAHLAIIVVTDEEDVIQTYDHDNNPFTPEIEKTVEDYMNYLKSVSDSELGVSFHSIAVLEGETENEHTSSPCFIDHDNNVNTPKVSKLNEFASEGLRYTKLSELTGGVVASICKPFDQSLQEIAVSIIESTVEFDLSSTPKDPEKLQVWLKSPGSVDYTLVPKDNLNGWSYRYDSNSILFNGDSVPQQGSLIRLVYDPESL